MGAVTGKSVLRRLIFLSLRKRLKKEGHRVRMRVRNNLLAKYFSQDSIGLMGNAKPKTWRSSFESRKKVFKTAG